MTKTVFATCLFLIIICTAGFAQSNERIDELLEQEPAEFGHSLYVLLSAGGYIEDGTSVAAAYAGYSELGWQLSGKPIDAPVSIRELAYVIVKSLGVRGGVMYSLLPSPRYAYRELVYRGIISKQTQPDKIASGDQVLRYIGAVLRMQEGEKVRKLVVLVLFFCVGSLFAFDFGGNIDEAFIYNASGSVGIINSLKTSLWTTVGRPSGTFLNVRLSYINQLFGNTQTAPDPVAFPYMFDIDELSLGFSYPGGRVTMGRFLLSEPTRSIFAHKVDGLTLRHSFSPISVRFDFGYTGFLWKNASSVAPSLVDQYYAQSGDDVLGSPRLIGAFTVSSVPIFNQTIRLGALVQEDLRNQDNAITEGDTVKQPGLGGLLDTQYAFTHISGPIVPTVYYTVFGVYGAGRSLAYIDDAYQYSSISSFLAGASVQLYLQEFLYSFIQLRGVFASGDADATSFRESNTNGNLTTFISLTGLPTGQIFSPDPGNVVFGELMYSLKPAANSRIDLLNTLQVVTTALIFFRSTSGFISEPGIPAESDEQYLGTEIDISLRSRPFSDLGFSLSGGVFLPSTAFVTVDNDPEGPRFTLRATVSMSL